MQCAEVKAKVLEVDAQKQRISLGLALHHIAEADASLLADGEVADGAASDPDSDLDADLAAGLQTQQADGMGHFLAYAAGRSRFVTCSDLRQG